MGPDIIPIDNNYTNEEEEKRLFQKAVEEFRNSLKLNNNVKIEVKREQSINTLDQGNHAPITKKFSCWECYKIKPLENIFSSSEFPNKVK